MISFQFSLFHAIKLDKSLKQKNWTGRFGLVKLVKPQSQKKLKISQNQENKNKYKHKLRNKSN